MHQQALAGAWSAIEPGGTAQRDPIRNAPFALRHRPPGPTGRADRVQIRPIVQDLVEPAVRTGEVFSGPESRCAMAPRVAIILVRDVCLTVPPQLDDDPGIVLGADVIHRGGDELDQILARGFAGLDEGRVVLEEVLDRDRIGHRTALDLGSDGLIGTAVQAIAEMRRAQEGGDP